MLKNKSDLVQYLRDHIVGGMHVGQIRPGDRLPSIREMAAQLGKNARTVTAAYEVLEQEGIVHVRGRSGVFVAQQEVLGGEVSEEMARWMSGFLSEAWKRRIPVPMAADEVRRFTQARRIRCALVELVEDGIVALGHELKTDWGFEVQTLSPDTLDAATHVDFFAATSFYAPSIHAAAQALGKPLVVLTTHASLHEAIRGAISNGPLTVVAADPRFGERMRASHAPDEPEGIRLVLAQDGAAVARLDPQEPILFTRAARQLLGREPAPMIFPHSPTLSAETARTLASIVVRMNIEGESGR